MGGHVYRDAKTGHWYIQIQWLKKPEKFFSYEYKGVWFPFESQGHAQKILSLMQDDIDHGTFVPASYRKNSPLSIKTYSEIWIQASDACNNAKNKYRSHIKHAIKYFGENFDMRDFTQAHSRLILFKKQLHNLKTGAPLSNDAVYNVMGALKTMLNFYRCDNPYFVLPVFPKMSKTERDEVEFLTFEDQQTSLIRRSPAP